MPISLTQLIVNAALLLVLFIVVLIMMRLGSRYDYNYGISEVQEPIKRKMMYLIFAIILLGLSGAIYNLVITFL